MKGNFELPQDPIPLRPVRVFVSGSVDYDLEKIQRVTANLMRILGCEGCHSGYDIRIIRALDFTVHPETLEVNEILQQPWG